ncbi:MAG TPA: hypothetical protein VE127_17875 [Solirubrobacteraceae bacterium]|nr:hypothetical protein [Solirubrobacteraceae bacterium]
MAFASCPPSPASTPFTHWGDNNAYFLAPGGSFEGPAGQVGWSRSQASLTAGNEPFYVNDTSDSQSLTIPAGGRATSPYFCVDDTMRSLRFFAEQTAPGTDLEVRAFVQTDGGVQEVSLADLTDGSMPNWAPTAPITADTSAIPSGGSVMVSLELLAPGWTGSWRVDDIYVDPYRSG